MYFPRAIGLRKHTPERACSSRKACALERQINHNTNCNLQRALEVNTVYTALHGGLWEM